MCSS
ncbi:a0250a1b-ab5c-44d1-aa59-105ceb533dd8 [Thermothielavioides terrestris]|jgi:hypothetical protein